MKIIRKAGKPFSGWFGRKRNNKPDEIPEHMGEFGADGTPIDPGLGGYNEEQMEAEFADSYKDTPETESTGMIDNIDNGVDISYKDLQDIFEYVTITGTDAKKIGNTVLNIFKVPAYDFLSAADQSGIDLGEVEGQILNELRKNESFTLQISVPKSV